MINHIKWKLTIYDVAEQYIVEMRMNAILIKNYRERCEETICILDSIFGLFAPGQEK